MLLNPNTAQLRPLPGTRILEQPLGIEGTTLYDPKEPWRAWTLYCFFAPIATMALNGVRARLVDAQGFSTFCNQRDLEVLLGHGYPNQRCKWLGTRYVDPSDPDWYGLCMDEQDLLDDLHYRELQLRNGSPDPLQQQELVRYVHYDESLDKEERLLLTSDTHYVTGVSPDADFNTLERRWVSVETLPMDLGHV